MIIAILLLAQCEESPPRSESEQLSSPQSEQFLSDEPAEASQQLLLASHNGEIARIRQLLEEGADVSAADERGQTALMLAAFNGHTDIVWLLLEEGARIEARNRDGRTVLMFAASGPFPATVQVLLEAGASPDVADEIEGWTALMFASAEGNTEVARVLLEHGADPSLKDKDGETALDFAKNNGHVKVMQLLQGEK